MVRTEVRIRRLHSGKVIPYKKKERITVSSFYPDKRKVTSRSIFFFQEKKKEKQEVLWAEWEPITVRLWKEIVIPDEYGRYPSTHEISLHCWEKCLLHSNVFSSPIRDARGKISQELIQEIKDYRHGWILNDLVEKYTETARLTRYEQGVITDDARILFASSSNTVTNPHYLLSEALNIMNMSKGYHLAYDALSSLPQKTMAALQLVMRLAHEAESMEIEQERLKARAKQTATGR